VKAFVRYLERLNVIAWRAHHSVVGENYVLFPVLSMVRNALTQSHFFKQASERQDFLKIIVARFGRTKAALVDALDEMVRGKKTQRFADG